jgi:hypothetical protein
MASTRAVFQPGPGCASRAAGRRVRPGQRAGGLGRHGISFGEHRPAERLDRLALAEVRRQVHHRDLVTRLFRHLEPGEGVGLSSHDNDHAGLLVGPAHSLHRVSEVLHVPPVSKEVHVLAHALHQAVRLQCVAACKSETTLAEATQPDTGQSVLQLIHALRDPHQFRETLTQLLRTRLGNHRQPHTSSRARPLTYRHTSTAEAASRSMRYSPTCSASPALPSTGQWSESGLATSMGVGIMVG